MVFPCTEKESAMKITNGTLGGMLTSFLTIIISIVVVFMAQIMLELRAEVRDLKSNLEASRTISTHPAGFQPFAALENNCVNCHSDRKFLGIHDASFDLKRIITKMENMPEVNLSARDRRKIHASLTLLKCVRCHSEDEGLKKIAQMSIEKQRQTIGRMVEKPGPKISKEETGKIIRALQEIQGF